MLAAELTKRITLYRPITKYRPLGDPYTEMEAVNTVWAHAESISNRKIRTADQEQVIETLRFTLRPRNDIDIDWLVEYRQRRFTVRALDRNQPDRLIITTEANIRHDRK
ncbi:phage head closure protein [Arsenophonus nasoniae]|uniref:Phage head closure protein n=2 Tax=Arsenophonus nasoniae TaxID=638 RepID=A0A4P7KXT3_9GAMM|nr:phage head closure protein [Arsenophonus nasoniae]QBY43470.1 Phage head-tail joining protein [Arsenophonus nasoniae]QBY43677.1 Phage head-tail joining protein [Arsenophonus nasoniae]QBY44775.1 Phage head-tail joining protein [Arsenophonus nasoniae]WGM04971.1 phage head closure protein [Arsenophonus nasoniae]WGM06859.1 phage head closure protein [Arsenophonus nasoniae]